MSMDFNEVQVGDSVSSIVGCNPELSVGSATSPNVEAMIRGGLKQVGVFLSDAISRSVEFGMAATGVSSQAANSVADAGMKVEQGISQAMQTMINGLSAPKK